MKIILNKFLSQSGFCSRRQAEVFIKEGKVLVNGKKAEVGMKVDQNDEIRIGDKILRNNLNKIYIILNKPTGYVCTNRKFKNEKNVFDLLPIKLKKNNKLFVAGRLDKNSRGLLLITNDGEFSQKLTHPKYKHQKKYQVKVKMKQKNNQKEVDNIIANFKKGVYIGEGDGKVKVNDINYNKAGFFNITLMQGKKRQIRRMFQSLNYEVDDLFRYELGCFRMLNLPSGKWKYIDIKKNIK